MSSIIGLSVGGCGSRIIDEFYAGIQSESMESEYNNVFFRNCSGGIGIVPRSIFIDTEDSNLLLMEQNKLYDPSSFIKPNSYIDGTSGNYARSWFAGGKILLDDVLERCRYEAEIADSLQGFHLMHSTGGGAGSGLLSLIISELRNEYSTSMITTTSILPSMTVSDSVLEPYNNTLCLSELSEFVDWSAIMKNDLLQNPRSTLPQYKTEKQWYDEWNYQNYHSSVPSHITKEAEKKYNLHALTPRNSSSLKPVQRSYVIENRMAAAYMVDLTASMREKGNTVNFRKMAMNLVPHPKMVFMSCASAPWRPYKPLLETSYHSKEPEAICYTIRESKSQLTCTNTLRQTQQHYDDKGASLIAACAVSRGLACGDLELSQLLNQMIPQNHTRTSIGSSINSDTTKSDRFLTTSLPHCPRSYGRSGVSLPNQPTLSMLICSRTISKELYEHSSRCKAMYMRRAYLHLFTQAGLEEDEIVDAIYTLNDTANSYDTYSLDAGDLIIEEPSSDEYQNMSMGHDRDAGESMRVEYDESGNSKGSRFGVGERDYSHTYSKLAPITPTSPLPSTRSPLVSSPEAGGSRTIRNDSNKKSYDRFRREAKILRSRSQERARGVKVDDNYHQGDHRGNIAEKNWKSIKSSKACGVNEIQGEATEVEREYAYEAEDENSTGDEVNQSLLGKHAYLSGLHHRQFLRNHSSHQRSTATSTDDERHYDEPKISVASNDQKHHSSNISSVGNPVEVLPKESTHPIRGLGLESIAMVPMIDIPPLPSRERFEETVVEEATLPNLTTLYSEEMDASSSLPPLSEEEKNEMKNEIPLLPSRDRYEEEASGAVISSQDQKEMEREKARRVNARRRFREHLKNTKFKGNRYQER